MEQKLFKLCIIELFLENKGKGKDENGHEKGGSSHNLWEEANLSRLSVLPTLGILMVHPCT